MTIAIADSKRRILLPKDIIEAYGQKFVIVKLPDEILLKPLPADPLKALQEEGKKLKGIGAQKIKREVDKYVKERV